MKVRKVILDAGNTIDSHVFWFYLLPTVDYMRIDGSKDECIPSETHIEFAWLIFYARLTVERDL